MEEARARERIAGAERLISFRVILAAQIDQRWRALLSQAEIMHV
jgi:hypothetical protein